MKIEVIMIIKENGRFDNGVVRYTFEHEGQEYHGHAYEIVNTLRRVMDKPFQYQWRYSQPNGAHKFTEVYYVH